MSDERGETRKAKKKRKKRDGDRIALLFGSSSSPAPREEYRSKRAAIEARLGAVEREKKELEQQRASRRLSSRGSALVVSSEALAAPEKRDSVEVTAGLEDMLGEPAQEPQDEFF